MNGLIDFFWERGGEHPRLKKLDAVILLVLVTLFVAPIILNALDIDIGQWAITKFYENGMPDTPSPGASGADQVQPVDYMRAASARSLYFLTLIFLAIGYFFVVMLRLIKNQVRNEFNQINSGISEKIDSKTNGEEVIVGLNAIRDRLYRPADTMKVTFALFDRLLIYSPLFIAQGMRYFEEEGLEAEFKVVGDDKEVAKAVRAGTFQFGACDPFECIPTDPNAPADDNDLQILFPLAKRFGFLVFGRKDIFERFRDGRPILIGTYEKGSTSYLAAMAFRTWLCDQLTLVGGGGDPGKLCERIKIDERAVTKKIFDDKQALARELPQWSFVVLWEPQSTWALENQGKPWNEFGVVGVRTATPPKPADPTITTAVVDDQFDFMAICRTAAEGASGLLGCDQWKAWKPGSTHSCLVSALVARRSTVRYSPVLCRRVYRALARTSVHLQGVDWDLDQHAKPSLFASIRHYLGTDGISKEVLERMTCGSVKEIRSPEERGGIFPFVPGWQDLPSLYTKHLQACHKLWDDNSGVEHRQRAEEQYERCFVRVADLKKSYSG